MSCGISSSFPEVFPTSGQVTHVLLTRPPLGWRSCPLRLARLACVKHAASVHSEPGSNSPLKSVRATKAPGGTEDRKVLCFLCSELFDASRTCFLFPARKPEGLQRRSQETLVFSKTRKKTSGTLYSVFKEPDPRGSPPRITPSHRRFRDRISAFRRKEQSTKTRSSCQRLFVRNRLKAQDERAENTRLRKTRKPLRGCAI